MADLVQSPLANEHAAGGVQLAGYHGALVPARFSNSTEEHLAVRRKAGVFDFAFRSHFALTGNDRARFLHRVVSQEIKSLTPGHGTYATLLNAQGHILADFRVYCLPDRFIIQTDADLLDKLKQGLQRYIIGDRVQIEPVNPAAISVQGPESRAILEQVLRADVPLLQEYDHLEITFADAPLRVVRATSTGEEGYELWTEAKNLGRLWNALLSQSPGATTLPCGIEALESLRIEAGIPRYGPDMGEDTLPLEAGLLNALSFTKGCYVGQEIVERARSRGHVNWKLAGVRIDSPAAPKPGEKLVAAGKEIGEITSSCISPTLGKTIALAYLRREVAEPGAKLALASGATAEVATLPF